MKQSKGKSKTSTSRPGGFGPGASGFGVFGDRSSGSSLSYLTEPPSLSAVADPNVVVSFKNVLKKDSTTKAKALEELVTHVQAHPFEKNGGVEEAILDVWVQLYPRTSIDNARRVRELSHALQFELLKSARKRMERHTPSIVGAWLAGLYDRDRVVARSANDGLSSFLNSPEKTLGFWKKCQGQILDYAVDAIQETQDTLSDERSTTKEDAEAKYFRVITSSLSLVLGLLQKVGVSDIEKFQSRYDDYFAEETVWRSITLSDSSVRKTVCQLLFACLDRKLPYAEGTKVRQAIVTGGLRTNQAGSALEYVRALTKLSQSNPDIWTGAGEKKSPLARLHTFISKGSQGSPPKFWEYLDQLLSLIPMATLTPETASALLTSLKSGVTHREEPRTNTSFAWKCYIDTARRLLGGLTADDQLVFGKDHLFPLFEQFLFSVSERPTSIPLGPNAMAVFVEAYIAVATAGSPLSSAFAEEWDRLASMFCANISRSLPEISKEYLSSQEKIGEEGRRWSGLVGHIYEKISECNDTVPDYTTEASARVLSQSISLLENRNLKPFGAARILEYALSTSPHLFRGEKWSILSGFLLSAAESDIGKLIESSSCQYLLSCVRLLGTFSNRDVDYSRLWKAWIGATLSLAPGKSRDSTLASLISHEKAAELSKSHQLLQDTIVAQTLTTIKRQADSWGLFDAAITYQALGDSVYQSLAQNLVSFFEKEPQSSVDILRALEILVKGRPQLFSDNEDLHTALVAHLLSLSEISDSSISTKTDSIRALLDSHADGKLPVVGIIQSNLDRAEPQSLGIDTIAAQAESASDISLEDIFPNTNIWMEQLALFFERTIDPSLSITSNIGGAAALIKGDRKSTPQVQRDRKGRSVPVRMALYLNRMLQSKAEFSALPQQFQVELLYLQCITVQLVSDQITTMSNDGPWKTLRGGEAISDAEKLVSSTRSFINTQFVAQNSGAKSLIPKLLIDLMMQQSRESSGRGLYSSRALCELIQSIVDQQGLTTELEEQLLKTEILKTTPETVLVAASVVAGLGKAAQGSKSVNNFCNRLVSDAAGASPEADRTHMSLVLLSLCGQIYDKGELPVANNRIVFAVRQITSWLDEPEDLSPALCAEICRSLSQLLPCMKDVYGSYWEKTLEFCTFLWSKTAAHELKEALPIIHASLRLSKSLETLPDPNDDLEDALKEFSESKSQALIELLSLPRQGSSQLLEIVDGMICREVEKFPMRHIPDLADIFPLVASESRDIQTAAFNLLHKAVPAQQEQKSVDVLLDKTGKYRPYSLNNMIQTC